MFSFFEFIDVIFEIVQFMIICCKIQNNIK